MGPTGSPSEGIPSLNGVGHGVDHLRNFKNFKMKHPFPINKSQVIASYHTQHQLMCVVGILD